MTRGAPAPDRRPAGGRARTTPPALQPGTHQLTWSTAELLRDLDVDNGWVLLIDGVPSSYVDLDAPTHLGFEYMAWIAGILDSLAPAGAPLDTVHVGGGACSMARYVAATRPKSRQLVLELDPKLIELSRDLLSLRRTPLLRTKARDGREGLRKEPAASADVVVRDAFDGLAVPAHLTTTGFLAEAKRVLRPGGAYVANLSGRAPFVEARREAATALHSFAHVTLHSEPSVLRGRRNGNVIITASDAPLPLDALLRRAAGGAAQARVLVGDRLTDFVGTAAPYEDPPAPTEGAGLADHEGGPGGVVDADDHVG
ncbi:methyltransferase family protein [Motilibacter peucedani]|uniref:Methyltransferase family protein n=1 Tax=Motilibacter peucedani TaxID=598650 RepID=A0A420XRY2_9ACTN|nr:fused MFS/spermidine synthase [Motilibacter peucedani]RKS77561.1 methyltransferase family protein [Motilibacter peucedani]